MNKKWLLSLFVAALSLNMASAFADEDSEPADDAALDEVQAADVETTEDAAE